MCDTEKLIDKIYEASVVPELWKPVLDSLGDLVDSAGTLMAIRNADGWGDWRASDALKRFMVEFTQSDIPNRTQATARLIKANHPGFLREQDLFTPDESARDPLFCELMRPLGFGTGVATTIEISTGDFVVFQILRRASRKDFDLEMIVRLDALRPHLARSAILAARLRLQRLQAAAEALAIIGLPAAILSPQGRVLAANELLQEMKSHVRWLPQDRMALMNSQANALLAQAIGNPRKPGVARSCSFPIAAPDGSNLVIGHLIPTPGQARDIFDGASAIFVLTPVSAPTAPDLTLIQSLFDLTPAEARVARGVAGGQTINTLAQCFGVSRETVRSQLKGILAKTGAHRQADLVSQLGGIGTHRIC